MGMNLIKLVMAVLGVYRMTRLIVNEAGPDDIMCRLRYQVRKRVECKQRGFWWTLNGLINCEYCLSFWAAALMAIFAMKAKRNKFAEWVLTWLGLAGAFCIAQELKDARDSQ
jgi:hypothetical protein